MNPIKRPDDPARAVAKLLSKLDDEDEEDLLSKLDDEDKDTLSWLLHLGMASPPGLVGAGEPGRAGPKPGGLR